MASGEARTDLGRRRGAATFRKRTMLASAAIVCGLVLCPPGMAADSAPPANPDTAKILEILRAQQQKLEQQERKLAEQTKRIEAQQQVLLQQQQRIQTLEYQLQSPAPPLVLPTVFSESADQFDLSPYYAQAQEPQAPVPVPPDTGEQPQPVPPSETTGEEERPESEKPKEVLLIEQGGVLLPAGTLQIEPGIEYAHASSDRVAISGFTIFDAIVIGVIRVDDLDRDIITGSLTARYGVTNRFQVETRIPGLYRQDSEILGLGTQDQTDRDIEGFGLGDVEAAVSWQPPLDWLPESFNEWFPQTVLRLRGRFPTGKSAFDIDRESVPGQPGRVFLEEAPTGSGFFGVGPGVTFVWRADPAVFFAGTSYTINIGRNFDEFGDVDPGDTFEWFTGVNFALSEQVGLSLSFVDQITGSTEQNGVTAEGTDVNDARLVVGTSVGLTDNASLLASAGVGITDESPDFSFTLSVPITFPLF
ncbi:MAG: hypothetical protein L0210_02075 [Rhodospirillales bacterium]|nr:hypothetical protein [Rhodospirillales bacterium]